LEKVRMSRDASPFANAVASFLVLPKMTFFGKSLLSTSYLMTMQAPQVAISRKRKFLGRKKPRQSINYR